MTNRQARRIGKIVGAFLERRTPETVDLMLTADPINIGAWGQEDYEVYGQFCKTDGDDVTLRALVSADGEVVLSRSEYPNMHGFIDLEASDEFTEAIQ